VPKNRKEKSKKLQKKAHPQLQALPCALVGLLETRHQTFFPKVLFLN